MSLLEIWCAWNLFVWQFLRHNFLHWSGYELANQQEESALSAGVGSASHVPTQVGYQP